MAVEVTYLKQMTFGGTAIPIESAKLSRDRNAIDNSDSINIGAGGITSFIRGLGKWMLEASGHVSNVAGYLTLLKQGGTPTAMTAEACALVSGQIYQITAATKRVIDPATAVVVKDGGVDHTSDVESIDYLFGKITFAGAYTVTGAVTIDADYIPTSEIAQDSGDFSLDLAMEIKQDANSTTRAEAQGNGGYAVARAGLITPTFSFSRLDDIAGALETLMDDGTPVLIEQSLASGALILRGWFTLTGIGNDGAIKGGGVETQSIKANHQSRTALDGTVITLSYATTASLNAGIKALLDNLFARTAETGEYLIDGTNGWSGDGLVGKVSLKGNMDTENFDATVYGSTALTAVP